MAARVQEEQVGPVPAPWSLRGSGYAVLYRLDRAEVVRLGAVPAELESRFVGGTTAVLVVDYLASEVGPFRELLLVPGRFREGGTSHYAATHIYVSTPASAASGMPNWGLPRRLADFVASCSGPNDRITVAVGGRTVASFTFRAGRFGLPVTTDIVPEARRTLVQRAGPLTYFTIPGGRGTLKRARLVDARTDGDGFPDLARHQPWAAVKVEGFHLSLPEARVVETEACGG